MRERVSKERRKSRLLGRPLFILWPFSTSFVNVGALGELIWGKYDFGEYPLSKPPSLRRIAAHDKGQVATFHYMSQDIEFPIS